MDQLFPLLVKNNLEHLLELFKHETPDDVTPHWGCTHSLRLVGLKIWTSSDIDETVSSRLLKIIYGQPLIYQCCENIDWKWNNITDSILEYKNSLDIMNKYQNIPWDMIDSNRDYFSYGITHLMKGNTEYEEYHSVKFLSDYKDEILFEKYPNIKLPDSLISDIWFLSLDYIEEHIDLKWDMFYLSYNKHLTPTFIEKYIDWEWNWYEFSFNIFHITMDFIEKHLDKDWDWLILSSNCNITIDFVQRHVTQEWDWKDVLRNSNIVLTDEKLEEYLINPPTDLGIEDVWEAISSNPNLSRTFIATHWNKLNSYETFSKNKFYSDHIVCRKILQRWWQNTIKGLKIKSISYSRDIIYCRTKTTEYVNNYLLGGIVKYI
jgi:hypothetical protein